MDRIGRVDHKEVVYVKTIGVKKLPSDSAVIRSPSDTVPKGLETEERVIFVHHCKGRDPTGPPYRKVVVSDSSSWSNL